MVSDRNNPFLIAQQQFDIAADILGLPDSIRAILRGAPARADGEFSGEDGQW